MEELQFIESMEGDRKATFGPKDKVSMVKLKRAASQLDKEKQRAEQQKACEPSCSYKTADEARISSGSSQSISEEEMYSPVKKK